MDVEWCRDRLQQYLDAVCAFEASDETDGPEAVMHQRYTTARASLKSLDGEQLDLDGQQPSWAVKRLDYQGLGILKDRAELSRALAPDTPTLLADRMRPWAWDTARPLWEIQQFRQAILAAATAINAQMQAKVGRRDISDDQPVAL